MPGTFTQLITIIVRMVVLKIVVIMTLEAVLLFATKSATIIIIIYMGH